MTELPKKKGTATGACVSVSYTNIHVHVELAQTNKGPLKPMFEYLFVEDIWGSFPGTEEQLKTYIEDLHKNEGKLQFALE